MNNKINELEETLRIYSALKDNGGVQAVNLQLTDQQAPNVCINNPEIIKKIIDLCVNEAEEKLYKEEFGDYPIDVKETREFKATQMLANAVNDYSFDPKRFAEALPYIHRTLQQNIFRLVIAIIKFMANDAYRTDGRNQAAHDTSKKLAEVLKNEYIPFI